MTALTPASRYWLDLMCMWDTYRTMSHGAVIIAIRTAELDHLIQQEQRVELDFMQTFYAVDSVVDEATDARKDMDHALYG